MDALELVLIFVAISTSECSVKPTCENYDVQSFYLLEGEAFFFVPYIFSYIPLPPDTEFIWYKNNSKVENISSDEKDRIHYHGGALFILNLLTDDSGLYTARHIHPSGQCSNYYVNVNVLKTSHKNNSKLFYGSITNSDVNKKVPCPEPVKKTCNVFKGNFTWYKNFSLLRGEHENRLLVEEATKDDEGIYTCVCLWKHNHQTYKSSASRWLTIKEQAAHRNLEIISPTKKEEFAAEGSEIKLNCSVFCGTKAEDYCHASWKINGKHVNQMDGYNQSTKIVTEIPSQNTISTAILTIEKVSAEDFRSELKCNGVGLYSANSITVSLKQRKSVIPVVFRGLCVFFLCLFAAVLVKCFAMDLTLFFRPYFPVRRNNKDVRMFDAYVVYQTQNVDKVTEDTLCQFVTDILPSVLEDKCGYRLFIHGRDDLPGKDSLELEEERMKQSRRLMVILTPGSDSQSESRETTPELPQRFDWQVRLQHALVQKDISVILIQLGNLGPQENKRLYPNLQHLIHKTAPIKWQESSRGATEWNSRFWKRVRYLMPAIPVRKYPHSAVV